MSIVSCWAPSNCALISALSSPTVVRCQRLNESFVLPLRPLTGAGATEEVRNARRGSRVALVTASSEAT
jgi:hypothetical protein